MDPTLIVGYTVDTNITGYSPNDFIWQSVDPTLNTTDCSNANTNTNSGAECISTIPPGSATWNDCTVHAACTNQRLGQTILANQSVHTGADVRYVDTKNTYNAQLLTSINLGVGIFGIGLFIFYNH